METHSQQLINQGAETLLHINMSRIIPYNLSYFTLFYMDFNRNMFPEPCIPVVSSLEISVLLLPYITDISCST